jgi:hypothetical protein
MEGKTARGASSPAKPAFTMPEPLSHTMALISFSSAVWKGRRAGQSMHTPSSYMFTSRRHPICAHEAPDAREEATG